MRMNFRLNEEILRIALIISSILFGVLSISLIALSVIYIDELWWPKQYIGLDILELPTMLMVLGSLSLIMALLGCYCAKNYNRKLLITFGAILSTVLCLELSIAIIVFSNYNEHEEINAKIQKTLWQDYDTSKRGAEIYLKKV